ncbi:hypothetical protein [Frankia sp. R43]|uniref:hypothetical protein n=1 Tax=Frankia sp. R43 TaxID=269536 RepID=UPI000A5ABE50|nr:hypothetical protein [Frankia sp. R43]
MTGFIPGCLLGIIDILADARENIPTISCHATTPRSIRETHPRPREIFDGKQYLFNVEDARDYPVPEKASQTLALTVPPGGTIRLTVSGRPVGLGRAKLGRAGPG